MTDTSYKRDQVIEIIGSVVQRMSENAPNDSALFQEVSCLKAAIDQMRADLSGAHPEGIQFHIPSATDELDAIVETTEQATHEIMGACEEMQKLLKERPSEETAALESQIIRIVEACTFQDLTGQRITKILRSLKEIDQRTTELSNILSKRFADLDNDMPQAANGDQLLNGPQLPDTGISQEEIDKLLADF